MISRRTPLKRVRIKWKPKKNGMSAERRRAIFERDGYACRNCGKPITWESGHAHHVKPKGRGVVDHSLANGITLCGWMLGGAGCHQRVHLVGNRAGWLWIIGPAEIAEFVNTNPKKVQS